MKGWRRGDAVRLRAGGPVLAFVLVTAVLSGCATGPATPPAATSTVAGAGKVTTAPDGVQEVTLQVEDDYVFTPARFTVKPGRVRLTVVSVATQLTHNFRFTPGKGPAEIPEDISLLAPGDRKTIEFTVQTPGTYGFECSFHVQLGQVGTMTVGG
ncbi:MAG: plastocyanin/azurin family copper-binding protein [Blastococcus sp.]